MRTQQKTSLPVATPTRAGKQRPIDGGGGHLASKTDHF